MIVAERLVDRIKAAGLSYTAVAKRVGVQQPTITRLARGDQHRTTHLTELARVLGTTSDYLEGKIDDPDMGAETGQRLSSDEAEWIGLYADLTETQRKLVRALVRDLARGNPSPDRRHTERPDP